MGIPEYFESKPTLSGAVSLGDFGVVKIIGWSGDGSYLLDGSLQLKVNAPKLRVYDVWALVGGDWFQLHHDLRSTYRWYNEDLARRPIDRVRLWVGAAWDMTLEPAPPRQATRGASSVSYSPPVVPSEEIPMYVPVVAGEPPLPSERPSVELSTHLIRWMHAVGSDVVVDALLEEWTGSAAEAAALGWMAGLPRGEDLLAAYARGPGADRRAVDHDEAFARWLTTELGVAAKRGLRNRRALEARRSGVRCLQHALARLLRGISDDFEVRLVAPPIIGDAVRHDWLLDEELAFRVDNPVKIRGAHRPIFIVRPMLICGDRVVVEGELV